MKDSRLLALVAETDPFPEDRALPEDLASADAAFANVVAWLEREDGPQPVAAGRRRRRSAFMAAAAAFLLVVALGVALLTLVRVPGSDPAETPTTVPPASTTSTTVAPESLARAATPAGDVALAEEAIRAWYTQNYDDTVRLLEGPIRSLGWTDDQVRGQFAYESAMGGRVEGITCTPPDEAGQSFECRYAYQNAATDALGLDTEALIEPIRVQVGDGRVIRWQPTDPFLVNASFAEYLDFIGMPEGYEGCVGTPVHAQCGQIQLEHPDAWSAWTQMSDSEIATAYVAAWRDGNCGIDIRLGGTLFCESAVAYERALQGEFDVSECEAVSNGFLRCSGMYVNDMSRAVDAPPVEAAVTVDLSFRDRVTGTFEVVRITGAYPRDDDLLASVETWAAENGLETELTSACGTSMSNTEECAVFLVEHLDDWAAWYLATSP